MKLTQVLPAAAVVGLLLATVVVFRSNARKPASVPVALPAEAPFASYLGGSGIIEASNQNISIGTSLPGIVKTVAVKVGDLAKAGRPLFQIDDRELRADLLVKQADLAKAEAAVQEAVASQADCRSQYDLVRNNQDARAVSVDDVQKRKNALGLADAKVYSAQVAVEAAQADLASTRSSIERLTVRAPMAGEVLQVNVRPGEYAATGALSTPLIRLGSQEELHIRVDIDENDAWRFKPGTRAMVFLRGNRDLKTPISFDHVEPYITPKTSLTGSSSERVDTRVLQVIYRFDRRAIPAYVGQQVDVFIETPEAPAAGTAIGGRS
jgi:multidrug efflux pump subunit AcrA (membrane-fusion protein)